MDGYSLKYKLYGLIRESANSSFVNTEDSYMYLYYAVCELYRRTEYLKTTQSITTVANQSSYAINKDFLSLYMLDQWNRYILKINDGSADYWMVYREYDAIYRTNSNYTASIPNHFTIIDSPVESSITGSATSNNSVDDYGESILTDENNSFDSVYPGDRVINITDNSSGYTLSAGNGTSVRTALLGGSTNGWASNDSYMIHPQKGYMLLLDPIPSTSNYTITLNYVAKPPIVFSDAGRYYFPDYFELPVLEYAAFLYKYRDSQPNFGDAWFKHFDQVCRESTKLNRGAKIRRSFKVNLRPNLIGGSSDGSWR